VAWIALAPLLVALAGASGWRALRLGYVTGAVSSLGLLYWTALVVVQYGGMPLLVGALVMVALCLAFSVFHALFGWLVGRFVAAFDLSGLLAAPVAWTALEYARSITFFQFPWCLLGYSQAGQPQFLQIATVTAVYGVSFLVAAVAALLAFAALEPRRSRQHAALAGAAGLVLLPWAYGAWQMSRPVHETGRVTVGLVQGGIRQEDKWVPEYAWANVGRHVELSQQAAGRGARLLVWPESAVPFVFDEDAELAGLLRRLVQSGRTYLFFGNDDRERPVGGGRGRIFVGAKLLSPDGELVVRYRKMQLVPFGEYVPLQPLFTLGGRFAAKLVQEVSDFTPGTEAVTGMVDGHAVGGTICYEAIFPSLVRRFPAQGAELLVNITNDAWYGTTSAPDQHLAMAALRAVENRRYLVRAANTGITAVIDPHGRVLERTRLFDTTVLVREVPFVDEETFYTRHGDVFALGCVAGALAMLAGTLRRRSRPVA
jgi:apolipoprotein N-acyltransferase